MVAILNCKMYKNKLRSRFWNAQHPLENVFLAFRIGQKILWLILLSPAARLMSFSLTFDARYSKYSLYFLWFHSKRSNCSDITDRLVGYSCCLRNLQEIIYWIYKMFYIKQCPPKISPSITNINLWEVNVTIFNSPSFKLCTSQT